MLPAAILLAAALSAGTADVDANKGLVEQVDALGAHLRIVPHPA